MRTGKDIVYAAIQQVTDCKDAAEIDNFIKWYPAVYNVAVAAVIIARWDMIDQVADAAKQYIETIKPE